MTTAAWVALTFIVMGLVFAGAFAIDEWVERRALARREQGQ